jgi:predicted HTH domain antitoxin
MDVRITLPDEVLEALGPNPEREALEGVLLLLVGEGRVSLERAADVLGMSREEAARWYAERVLSRSGTADSFPEDAERHVQLEDLTQEDLDRLDRFLDIPPATKGSGLSDVSINHDKYLAEDD